VNFFPKKLFTEEIYFCCPPVKEIGYAIRRMQRHGSITAILSGLARAHILGHAAHKLGFRVRDQNTPGVKTRFPRHRARKVNFQQENRHEDVGSSLAVRWVEH
jgi:hypothetical protein